MLINVRKIRARIVELGYTHAEVAKKMGITAATFSYRMQDGNFGANQLADLFRILEITNPENYLLAAED